MTSSRNSFHLLSVRTLRKRIAPNSAGSRLRGLTQEELSAASGLSKIAISRLENGYRKPRWSTAQKLAKALDVDPEQLFPDEGEPTPADVLAEHLRIER